MAQRKHDWTTIETEYVSGDLSLRELAAKFDVNEGLLMERAAAEHWKDKRDEYRSRVRESILAKIEAQNIEDGFSAYRALKVTLRVAWEEYMFDPASAKKLVALTGILKVALAVEGYDTSRSSFSLGIDAAQPHHDIDLERFITNASAKFFGLLGDGESDETDKDKDS